jgi:chromosome segregation ATPase
MTTDQITLHLCEVIAEQKEKINQLESAYNYQRGRNDDLVDGMAELTASIAEKDLLIAQLEAAVNGINDDFKSLNNQIAEQKETIETLQSSLKNLDSEYISLKFDFNELVKKHQDLDTQYMTLKGLDNGK